MFLNPASGANGEIVAAAENAGLEVVRLSRALDVTAEIRRRMQEGRRLFIAAGGDGTVNCVIQPLINSDATLGVIPLGTFNHFARDAGVPMEWREALETALTGTTRQVDAARVNDRFFVNNLSLGLYPELVARREERGRDTPRWKARLYAAYGTLRKYPHVTVALESEHHQMAVRTHVLMVSNNQYDLSRIGVDAPRNTLEEGRLSVYWLPHLRRITLMRFLAHYLAGRVHETPGFRSFRTSRMKVHASKQHLRAGVDGELFTFPLPLVITIVPKSLLVRSAGVPPAGPAASRR
ncbi:MAG TPA: diacylglycerol kinase family protein [Thermoanaerobaculia bacterium]|nr:diacylglycerol kinase family protein [Thermoanaerobaculia bacterium]